MSVFGNSPSRQASPDSDSGSGPTRPSDPIVAHNLGILLNEFHFCGCDKAFEQGTRVGFIVVDNDGRITSIPRGHYEGRNKVVVISTVPDAGSVDKMTHEISFDGSISPEGLKRIHSALEAYAHLRPEQKITLTDFAFSAKVATFTPSGPPPPMMTGMMNALALQSFPRLAAQIVRESGETEFFMATDSSGKILEFTPRAADAPGKLFSKIVLDSASLSAGEASQLENVKCRIEFNRELSTAAMDQVRSAYEKFLARSGGKFEFIYVHAPEHVPAFTFEPREGGLYFKESLMDGTVVRLTHDLTDYGLRVMNRESFERINADAVQKNAEVKWWLVREDAPDKHVPLRAAQTVFLHSVKDSRAGEGCGDALGLPDSIVRNLQVTNRGDRQLEVISLNYCSYTVEVPAHTVFRILEEETTMTPNPKKPNASA